MIELVVFENEKPVTLRFEHSLVSLSKWESKHQIPFQGRQAKTLDQMIDYYQCMLLNRKVDPTIVYRLSPEQHDQLVSYINEDRSATHVPTEKSSGIVETQTAELIYYWMVELKIPFEPTNTWHLSQTLKLIQLTAWKKAPEKKRTAREVMSDWRRDNERQKKILGIVD